jgi:hypothetical protein
MSITAAQVRESRTPASSSFRVSRREAEEVKVKLPWQS